MVITTQLKWQTEIRILCSCFFCCLFLFFYKKKFENILSFVFNYSVFLDELMNESMERIGRLQPKALLLFGLAGQLNHALRMNKYITCLNAKRWIFFNYFYHPGVDLILAFNLIFLNCLWY